MSLITANTLICRRPFWFHVIYHRERDVNTFYSHHRSTTWIYEAQHTAARPAQSDGGVEPIITAWLGMQGYFCAAGSLEDALNEKVS